MCGVAGIFLHSKKADLRKLGVIAQMTATLQHRGPDASGGSRSWIFRRQESSRCCRVARISS